MMNDISSGSSFLTEFVALGSKLHWFKTSNGDHRTIGLFSQKRSKFCCTRLMRKCTLIAYVLAESVFLMSCGSSSNVASTALNVQGHVLCYCDGSAWYTNDGNNYYWAAVCYITSPWSSPWFWRGGQCSTS